MLELANYKIIENKYYTIIGNVFEETQITSSIILKYNNPYTLLFRKIKFHVGCKLVVNF